MPDKPLPSQSTLVVATKLEALHDDVKQIVSQQHESLKNQVALNERVGHVQSDVDQLYVHVVEGNGKPGLLDRVLRLETKHEHDSERLGNFVGKVESLGAKVENTHAELRTTALKVDGISDRVKNTSEKMDAAFSAQQDKARQDAKARIGWIVAIAVAFITSLGSIIAAVLHAGK